MSTQAEPGDVLFAKTRRRVLGLLYSHPDEAFYVREIVRRTGQAPGAVQRELELLASADLVRRTRRGHQVYFEANRDSPVYPELQGLVLKTTGVVEVLREALQVFADRIRVALVYGSGARAALRKASDIDLLVVGAVSFDDVVEVLAPAQQRLGREINPSVYTPSEFAAKLGSHFLQTVLRGSVTFVMGDEDELRRVEEERLARGTRDEPGGSSRPPRRGGTRSQRQRGERSKR